ncbi:hypothetical protein BpHYR1_001680 [Brachionus plicatilis]|uniref:Uncharacterized protein n=1 Tax=Brachionus plicatilis TaxID=10195 RepID=A0A3M7SPB5_BRAPC|nr:hypothetical protein BpHYR1_001680 [Brachionus plicatilis]
MEKNSLIIQWANLANSVRIFHKNFYQYLLHLALHEQRKYKAGIYFDHEGPRTKNNIEGYHNKLKTIYTDASYTFRRQMLILGKLTVDEYIGMILATMSEEEKKTKKCVAYSGDISDSDSEEEEEIYDDA